jgi:hypothetical protein
VSSSWPLIHAAPFNQRGEASNRDSTSYEIIRVPSPAVGDEMETRYPV